MCIPFSTTVTEPSNHNVGSGPIENIHRNITDATSVRIPDSRGNVITIANDDNIMAHISIDMCEFNSAVKKTKKKFVWKLFLYECVVRMCNYLELLNRMDRKMQRYNSLIQHC